MLNVRAVEVAGAGRRRHSEQARRRLRFALDPAGETEVLKVAVEQQHRAARAVAVFDQKRGGRRLRHPLNAHVPTLRRTSPRLTDSPRLKAASSKSQLQRPASPAFHTSFPVRHVTALTPVSPPLRRSIIT